MTKTHLPTPEEIRAAYRPLAGKPLYQHIPENLRAPKILMNEILAYDTAQIESDFYLQIHSTNPLLKAGTLSSAIRKFLGQYPAFDSMFSVTRWQTRFYDQLTRPINHNPTILSNTQDLPPRLRRKLLLLHLHPPRPAGALQPDG